MCGDCWFPRLCLVADLSHLHLIPLMSALVLRISLCSLLVAEAPCLLGTDYYSRSVCYHSAEYLPLCLPFLSKVHATMCLALLIPCVSL